MEAIAILRKLFILERSGILSRVSVTPTLKEISFIVSGA
jgi:hypothetical protein